jgi:hypothetical protein
MWPSLLPPDRDVFELGEPPNPGAATPRTKFTSRPPPHRARPGPGCKLAPVAAPNRPGDTTRQISPVFRLLGPVAFPIHQMGAQILRFAAG